MASGRRSLRMRQGQRMARKRRRCFSRNAAGMLRVRNQQIMTFATNKGIGYSWRRFDFGSRTPVTSTTPHLRETILRHLPEIARTRPTLFGLQTDEDTRSDMIKRMMQARQPLTNSPLPLADITIPLQSPSQSAEQYLDYLQSFYSTYNK